MTPASVKGVLPDLIKIVDGDPRRVLSISDFDEGGLGVRTTGRARGKILIAVDPSAVAGASGWSIIQP